MLLVGRPGGTDPNAIGSFPLPAGWAPDGEDFAFLRDSNVWIAHADGSGVRNLTNFELGGATGASWSPDRRQIAVLQGATIWVFDPDGTGTGASCGYGPWDSPVWLARLVAGRFLACSGAGPGHSLFNAGHMWHPVLLANNRTARVDARTVDISPWRRPALLLGDSIDLMNADGSARQDVWRSPSVVESSIESWCGFPEPRDLGRMVGLSISCRSCAGSSMDRARRPRTSEGPQSPTGLSDEDLSTRTLTNLYNQKSMWLANAHADLDRAVLHAYDWPSDDDDDEILRRLLALNLERLPT